MFDLPPTPTYGAPVATPVAVSVDSSEDTAPSTTKRKKIWCSSSFVPPFINVSISS